jgi:O-antigen ligase
MDKENPKSFRSLTPPARIQQKSYESLHPPIESYQEKPKELPEASHYHNSQIHELKSTSSDLTISTGSSFIQNLKAESPTYPRINKSDKTIKRAFKLLFSESWVMQNGHLVTYVGLYVFSILVWFRPYELIPSLGFLSATAFYVALATLFIIPSQFFSEGSLTTFPVEVKCVIALMILAIITMFIGKDFARSWQSFNDTFSKAILVFVIMVNVVRTPRRFFSMLFISLSIAFIVSFIAINLYFKGEFKVEGYRVGLDIGGMFGNPNDMALHLVTMIPIAFCLMFVAKNFLIRLFFLGSVMLFICAMMVTFSRGAFLAFLISSAVLAWKLGRKNRLKIITTFAVGSIFLMLLAPGNYLLRLFSIFIPQLDPVGSVDQRRGLFLRSIYVTLRNPWGIGLGNSRIMNDYNLEWHNAYMQIASELGIVALFIYLIFLISPLKRLAAIEKIQENEADWFYYLSVGLQASLVAYMVGSFFASVAYNWYVYYLVAYAVALRRIYRTKKLMQ